MVRSVMPRIIHLPMSGRDRRHYVQQLRIGEQEQRSLARRVDDAYRVADETLRMAHALACREWNARQFIGGDAAPSPAIAHAIDAGYDLLEVKCRRCGHESVVDLALVIWPREHQVHTLERALGCQQCRRNGDKKSRPDLVALRMRNPPALDPAAARLARRG
jgi:hypothetical protein